MVDESSAHIKNEMLLTDRLHNLEQERDFRKNPLPIPWIFKMPRMNATTVSNTAETDLDVKDAKIPQLLEESDRLCDEKARLQTLLDESASSYSGTTLTTQSARVLHTQIQNRAVPLPDIISFLCRVVSDYDTWGRSLVHMWDVLSEGMETGRFVIDDRSFGETELGW